MALATAPGLKLDRHLGCVEEVADRLAIDHALQQLKLGDHVAEPGFERRRQSRFGAGEKRLYRPN